MPGVSSPTSPRSTSIPWIAPVPVNSRPYSVSSQEPPMSVKISLSLSPGCVVRAGQSGTTTLPPVTRAAARNGCALDRSGSMVRSRPSSAPGVTRHTFGSPPDSGVSTCAPTARSMSTVMRMCGREGREEPMWRTSTPWLKRGPDRSRADTNWDDEDASISTGPPSSAPPPWTVSGSVPRPSSSIRAPSTRSASITPVRGRSYDLGSPSKRMGPSASAATGGRKRITVPALPTSTVAGPCRPVGSTRQVSPVPSGPTPSSMPTPIARRAPAISSVSRERRGGAASRVPRRGRRARGRGW